MKVGILTYHNTANYGAALQAFATQQAFTNLGVDAEIIDYTNEQRRGNYSVSKRFLKQLRQRHLLQAVKTLAGMPMILSRSKNFSAFYRTHLKLSTSVFRSMKSLRENPPVYDVYLAGSDQVWNYRNNGDDPNYMLDFVSDKSKTLSYASSFGLDDIPAKRKQTYARLLSEIRFISVRECMGAVLVNQLTGRKPEIVLDPVFLPERRFWYELAKEDDSPKRPYILLYTSKPGFFPEYQATTNTNIDKKDLVKIGSDISFSDLFRRHMRVRSTVGPDSFLGYIKNADLVLTSSFHGTAFSILMEKPFIAFLSGDKGRDARIVELLYSLGLSDRIFTPSTTIDIAERKINYEAVNHKLSDMRAQSISFIRNAIKRLT